MVDTDFERAIKRTDLPIEQYLLSLSAGEFTDIVNQRISSCTPEQIEQIARIARSNFSPRIFDKTFDPLGFGKLDGNHGTITEHLAAISEDWAVVLSEKPGSKPDCCTDTGGWESLIWADNIKKYA